MGICINELLVDFVLDWYGIDLLLFGTASVYLTNAEVYKPTCNPMMVHFCSIWNGYVVICMWIMCGRIWGFGWLWCSLHFLAHEVFMWEFVSVDCWRILYLFDTILTCFCYSFDVLAMFLYQPVHQLKAGSYIILNKSN